MSDSGKRVRGGVDARRKRRNKMRARYRELVNETAVRRTQMMYQEFGPFWYKRMLSDETLTDAENASPRIRIWKNFHTR